MEKHPYKYRSLFIKEGHYNNPIFWSYLIKTCEKYNIKLDEFYLSYFQLNNNGLKILHKETDYGTFCLLDNDLISNNILKNGSWEPHLIFFYNKFIKSDYIIIDGGANLGFHTICFAKLLKNGTVYSFDPQPLIFDLLYINILINGVSNIVKPFKLALGDKEEILKMDKLKYQFLSDNYINYGGRGITHSEEGEEEVNVITIDGMCIPKIDLIKLDIQSFELEGLSGGEKSIKNNLPIIFLENYLDYKKDKLVIEMLESWGYKNYRIDIGNKEDCILLFPDKHKEEIKFIEYQNEFQFIK
jgi:FkbM family methyltransferase